MTLVSEKTRKHSEFSSSNSTQKLKKLAEKPFDLTKEGNLTPERLAKFYAESCGYKFLYGTERVTEEVMRTLVDLAGEAKALEKMEKMQSGEVMNHIEGYPSENRTVLHTATRDFFEHPNQAKPAAAAAKLSRQELDKLKAFLEKIDKEGRFTDLIAIGIGGSDLGPRAHYIALEKHLKPGRKVHFISNVDPDDAALNLKGIDLKKALVVVVSKTGTTLESLTNEALVKARFLKMGLKPEEHFISVTSEKSPMDDPKKYLACFHVWDWVGGRFSVTSMVGGVILAYAFGIDVFWEFLKGANAMDKAALTPSIVTNLPLLSALLGIWNRNFLGYPTVALIPYSNALLRYSAHLQQLDMESNGKRIDQKGYPVDFLTGPIIWGEPGTNAQHSYFQLIHQGTDLIPLEFIGFKESQFQEDLEVKETTSQEKLLANLFAQMIALAKGQQSDNPNQVFEGNRPSHLLLGKQLTPFALGALLAYYEHKVAFQGFIWRINSFDQEGVQLGKVLANKLIERFAAKRKGVEGTSYPLGDSLIKFFNLGKIKSCRHGL